MTITIWHNPRCSKSRAALALIRERGIEPVVVEYLKTPPTEAEIRAALVSLGIEARSLVRTCEPAFKTRALTRESGEDALVAAMAADPILIERPVVFANGAARIGRPPELVEEIL